MQGYVVISCCTLLFQAVGGEKENSLRALYGAVNYSIVGPRKRFCIQSIEWHSWDKNRKKDHVQKFRSFVPGKTDLFSKPRNSGRKPCYQTFYRKIKCNLLNFRRVKNGYHQDFQYLMASIHFFL